MSAPHYLLLLEPTPRDADDPHRPLNEYGRSMLEGLPSIFQDAEEYKSLCHAFGREMAFMLARLDHLREQFWPQSADEMGLPWWEELVGRVADQDATVEQRRLAIMLALQGTDGSGSEWEGILNRALAAGWAYVEHDPGDDGDDVPPPYTVRVTVPYAPMSPKFLSTQRLLREITPANLHLELLTSDVFRVDQDQLDQDTLTY